MNRLLALIALALFAGAGQAGSYSFTQGSSDVIESGEDAFTDIAYPATLMCWRRDDEWANNLLWLMQLGNDTTGNGGDVLSMAQASDGSSFDRLVARAEDGTLGDAIHDDAEDEWANTWVMVMAEFASATSRTAIIDNAANSTEDTTSVTIGTVLDTLAIGNRNNGSWSAGGNLSHCALWSTTFTDTEKNELGNGACPSDYGGADLIDYWPLNEDNATQTGTVNSIDLTVSGASFDSMLEAPVSCDASASWTSGPTVSSPTSSSYQFDFTTDIDSTVYGVACHPAIADPTGAQVVAGDCGDDTDAVSTCTANTTGGVADTCTLNGVVWPRHDLFIIACPESGICE